MPLAWGLLHPVVLLPKGASEWPEGRLQAVLLHELIHVRRRDLLAQAIAQAACCLYWFHPLAWLGLRQQRQERERACDDAVLAAGLVPHDYAAHLLDLVRGMAARGARWANAPAMAEAAGLELRVRDLLARNRNRRPLSRPAAVAVATAMAAVFLPLVALTALAQTPSGLSGTVRDPSGAVIPGCTVAAKNLNGTNEETTKCDMVGHYSFASIPAGDYSLEVSSQGFKRWTIGKLTLLTGLPAQVDVNLTIGEINQSVTVQGQGPQRAAVPMSGTPERTRVGGMVKAAMLIRQPRPDYPADLQAAGVQGVVKLRAIIGKDGSVLHAEVINTVDSRLAQLALNAVNQWVYQPILLNGEAVEVVTSIDINFNLE
jgi:TonB family protein